MITQSFLEELSAFVLSLGERNPRVFSHSLHWMLLANGDADFHDNVIFFGFNDNQAGPVLVAKVPRLTENGWMLQAEYDHLVELWNRIGEEAERYVPAPYGLAEIQQRPVLMLSYVPGESLTRLSRRSFWGNSQQVSELANEAARLLRDLNRFTETPLKSETSPEPSFSAKADKFRELFRLTPEEDEVLTELADIVKERVASAPHKVIIQGDFWHGNMIRDERQGLLRLIDWQFARWSADVSMDVYFFLLAGALSAAESEAVASRAREAFALLREWRKDVIPEYVSAYGMPERYSLLPEKYGMLLCCVEKAVRSAIEFGYGHPDDLLWRYLFAELLHWQDEG